MNYTAKHDIISTMNNSQPETYAFIDGQNINLGVSVDITDKKTGNIIYTGWKMDFRKFRLYLKNKYNVTSAYYFIGNKPGNEGLYTYLQNAGYIVVLKPTLPYMQNGVSNTKGNVDAELVLYACTTIEKYERAIIVSGDGDFLCLAEFMDLNNKLGYIMTPNHRYSSLLNRYASKIITIGTSSNLKNILQKK